MRILAGVVRAGSIELDDRAAASALPDGTRVTVFVEARDRVEADDDDRSADGIPVEEIAIQPLPEPAPEPTVLVVEDDPDLSDVFAEVIEAAGYRVERARDGREALRVLEDARRRPHLILLDMRMPNMDGEQFRRAQEADAGIADIPVVVTSADTNVVETVAAMDVAAFLPKPVNRSELVATISRLCDDDDDDVGGR